LNPFVSLLRQNHNYRNTWIGQVVSEVGDHFNNIAVFSLVVSTTKSGLVVSGVMLARAIPAILIGPLAGVVLDRFDRKRVMIASDLFRAVVAACFVFTIGRHDSWLLYLLSALLMAASPFFSAGRAAILPSIASKDELHTANSLTQTTQWTTLSIGAFLGGSIAQFSYEAAFIFNAASFLISALCISRLKLPGRGFRPVRAYTEAEVVRPWHEYKEGLAYMRSRPLILGIGGIAVGWATGGGAAQILFSMFGEIVFHRGPAGIGIIWGCAGVGLICGSFIAYRLGKRLSFEGYKRAMIVCYIVHGGAYVIFSQMRSFAFALVFIAMSRAAVGVSSVLNMAQLLRHIDDRYRGRVFSTIESAQWSVMMLSMTAAGVAAATLDPNRIRLIGSIAGALSSTTAIFWGWAHFTGRLPEPPAEGVPPEEVEIHGERAI
jgi:MFS family permease